jgi:hypothetical protein
MRFLLRWIWRGVLALVLLVVVLLLPVAYVELACVGPETEPDSRVAIIAPEWQRDESRTLTTYPEWHIVHAYDDYARVITDGDPHEFGYIRAIAGFWTSLCPLKERASTMGGMTDNQKMTIYTIGVSFSAELLAKAAYEETVGRIATLLRGPERAPLDDVSAERAAAYAQFLQQTPWYKWPFDEDIKVLENEGTDSFRDRERRFALRNEAFAKLQYAGVIAQAVEGIGADELRMRSVVAGLDEAALTAFEGVDVIGPVGTGIEIETDRYRQFTKLAVEIASAGADFVEIAGNDDILFTALSDQATYPEAVFSFARQGYGDHRHLFVVPVNTLAERLRNMGDLRLEHIHDY